MQNNIVGYSGVRTARSRMGPLCVLRSVGVVTRAIPTQAAKTNAALVAPFAVHTALPLPDQPSSQTTPTVPVVVAVPVPPSPFSLSLLAISIPVQVAAGVPSNKSDAQRVISG